MSLVTITFSVFLLQIHMAVRLHKCHVVQQWVKKLN